MKIIFLDIDGVLNNELQYRSEYFKVVEDTNEINQFDPICVGLLNRLTDHTEAKIVVSSSWRHGRTVEQLKELLNNKVGITGEIIDKTPMLSFQTWEEIEYDYSVPRGCEIKAWMELNKNILGNKITKTKYVILDDDSDMLYWQRNNYIQVDPYCGLTPQIIRKAKQILS